MKIEPFILKLNLMIAERYVERYDNRTSDAARRTAAV